MRVLVDLRDVQIGALDRLAKRREVSRAALMRDAVDEYLRRHGAEEAEEHSAPGGTLLRTGWPSRSGSAADGEGPL